MKHLRQADGYSMLLTVFAIVLISVIGLGLLTMNINSLNTSKNEAVDQSVYYIAEAGLNLEKAKLIEELNGIIDDFFDVNGQLLADNRITVSDFLNQMESYFINQSYILICGHSYNGQECISPSNSYQDFNEQFSLKPVSNTQVSLICGSDECIYTLTAHGSFEESPSKKRSLSQVLTVDLGKFSPSAHTGPSETNPGPPNLSISNFTAITSGNITLEGSAKIYGHAASGGTVTLNWGTGIPGSLAIPPGNLSYPDWFPAESLPTVNDPIDLELGDFLPNFPLTNFGTLTNLIPPDVEVSESEDNKTNIIENGNFLATNWMTNNYVLNLNNDTYFKNFNVREDNTITLNIGNNDINLYVENLDISQGHIKIAGTGKLNIIVKDSINIKGSFNNNGDSSQIILYYQGTSPITFSNETSLYGSFYTNTADLTLTGGAAFKGNIYSGGTRITISGGVPTNGQYIIAPNTDLRLLEGGNITGTVVAKSIYANGGTSITYGASVLPIPGVPAPGNPTIDEEDFKKNLLIEFSIVEL